MMRLRCLFSLVLLPLIVGRALIASEPPATIAARASIPSPTELAAIIKQLDNDDYSMREQASAELAALPPEALPALQTALNNVKLTPESAVRSEKAVFQLKLKAKLAKFRVNTGADPAKIADSNEVITQIIPLDDIAAGDLREDIIPLMSADAEIEVSPAPSNSLMITDKSAKIKRLAEILQELNSPILDHFSVEYRQLLHVKAADAAGVLNTMFIPAGAPASRGPGRFTQIIGPLYAESDERTNTVILFGPHDQVVQAYAMLEKLEQMGAAGEVANPPAAGRGARGG
ncbi:MAG TPA: hypothetical protein VGN88_07785, partial [Phycisphaerae bacterium]